FRSAIPLLFFLPSWRRIRSFCYLPRFCYCPCSPFCTTFLCWRHFCSWCWWRCLMSNGLRRLSDLCGVSVLRDVGLYELGSGMCPCVTSACLLLFWYRFSFVHSVGR